MFTNLNRRSLIGSNRPQTLQASAQKKLMHVFPDRPRSLFYFVPQKNLTANPAMFFQILASHTFFYW